MTRAILLACLAIASGLHARALPDSTRDALLMGYPVWEPATGRVAIVEAPASCCVGMLPQLFVLDANRQRLLETWGPREVAENNDEVAARHSRALLARMNRVLGGRKMRSLQPADSVEPVLSSDGTVVSFAFQLEGKARKTRRIPVQTYPAPPPCCGVPLDSLPAHPEACLMSAGTWRLWSLPELPWALVASYANREPDGCERGPDFRIVRLAP